MADEEEETPQATAVADPPIIETPTETPEAVPPVEQEQVPEGETPEETDSGAEQVEEEATELSPEDRRTAFLDRVDAVYEADPEMAKLAEERKPKPAEDVGDERFKWETEKSQEERDAEWVRLNQSVAPYIAPQGGSSQAQAAIQGILETYNDAYLDSAKKLQDGTITDPAQLKFDTQAWASKIAPYISGAASVSYNAARAGEGLKARGAIEASSSFRLMNADERKAYKAAVQANDIAELVTVAVNAASRSAPESFTKEATKKAEKKANVLDLTKKVFDGLGINGKKPKGTAPKTKEYKDMTADERAAMTPEEIDADTKSWLAQQR